MLNDLLNFKPKITHFAIIDLKDLIEEQEKINIKQLLPL